MKDSCVSINTNENTMIKEATTTKNNADNLFKSDYTLISGVDSLNDTSFGSNEVKSINSSENSCEKVEDIQNLVEFHCNKEITPDVLDMILLFLENPKSGGGEYIDFKIEPSAPKIITVNYKKKLYKERVLARGNLTFKSFNLRACLPVEESSHKANYRVIILKNFDDNEDIDLVQMYAENLVMIDDETNDACSIEKSRIFEKTFYVHFKHDYDPNLVLNRFQKRSTYRSNPIKLIPAFSTKIIIVKVNDWQNQVNLELIEIYFTNKKRSGISSFKSIYEKGRFVLIELNSNQDLDAVLSRTHKISQSELIVERLYNVSLLNEAVVEEEAVKQSDVNVAAMVESLVSKDESLENIQQTQVLTEPTFKLTRLSIILDLRKFPNSKILDFFNGFYMNALLEKLRELNASLSRVNENEMRVSYENQLPENLNKDEFVKFESKWQMRVKNCVEEFLANFDSRIVKLDSAKSLSSLKFDKLAVEIYQVSEDSFEVFGLKSAVDSVVEQIEALNRADEDSEVSTDQISDLKLHEIRILFVNKFAKLIKEKFGDEVLLNILPKDGAVKIQGTRSQINYVKKRALEILGSVKKREIAANAALVKFILTKENLMASWLRNNSISCVIEADAKRNAILVYSTDEAEISNCVSKMKEEIVYKEFETRVLEDDEIVGDFVVSVESEPDIVCTQEKSILFICGLRDKVEHYYDVLKKMSF